AKHSCCSPSIAEAKTALGLWMEPLFSTDARPGWRAGRRSIARQLFDTNSGIYFGRRLVKYQLPGQSVRFKLLKLFF
ncbi:MAG: hypothetical protein Q7T78_16100, partial [Rhodoferax sp.]|nr:hypothetical protein [Rhodoferax sp.]